MHHFEIEVRYFVLPDLYYAINGRFKVRVVDWLCPGWALIIPEEKNVRINCETEKVPVPPERRFKRELGVELDIIAADRFKVTFEDSIDLPFLLQS